MATLTIIRRGNIFGYELTIDNFTSSMDVKDITDKANEIHQRNVNYVMERVRQLREKGLVKKKEVVNNNNINN